MSLYTIWWILCDHGQLYSTDIQPLMRLIHPCVGILDSWLGMLRGWIMNSADHACSSLMSVIWAFEVFWYACLVVMWICDMDCVSIAVLYACSRFCECLMLTLRALWHLICFAVIYSFLRRVNTACHRTHAGWNSFFLRGNTVCAGQWPDLSWRKGIEKMHLSLTKFSHSKM